MLIMQEEPLGFDRKDGLWTHYKVEQMSNEALKEQKEAAARRHGRAWCPTPVL